MATIADKIKWYTAWLNDEPMEYRYADRNTNDTWELCKHNPTMYSDKFEYRIKPREPREWWLHQERQDGPMVVAQHDCGVPGCIRTHVREVIEP